MYETGTESILGKGAASSTDPQVSSSPLVISLSIPAVLLLQPGAPPQESPSTGSVTGMDDASVVAARSIPDLALLRGFPRGGDAAPIKGSQSGTSDTVYAFGFGSGAVDPNFSKGMVSCARVGAITISAHAENGFSGMHAWAELSLNHDVAHIRVGNPTIGWG